MPPGGRLLLALVLAASVYACGNEADQTGPGGRTPDLADARAYLGDSGVADELVSCVDPRRQPSSCTIGVLPPIAWREREPSVAAIMERVVVSHDWMGERFATILERVPAELRRLLGSVTAIVIDDDVRPSFYWTLTGAIYIDPGHLWLTPEEEATVSDQPDYRTGFGSDLGFVPFSAYLDPEGGPAFSGSRGAARDLAGRSAAVAALLFHESAHANDFLPRDEVASLDADETFVDAVERLEGRRLSRRLTAAMPLTSALWVGLARVLYFGEDASAEERNLSAEQVGLAFAPDGASDPYAYSSSQEDLAMLFEETMLKRHFGFDRRVGFATPNPDGVQDCRDYTVGWGARSRVASVSVAPRAQRVAELVLGDSLGAFFDALPPSTPLTAGEDLCIDTTESPESVLRWR